MKIQTQARLLMAGIVLAPLLIVLTNVVFTHFFRTDGYTGIPEYEDVSALLNENISFQDWESVTRFVARSQNIGEVAVFRSDYLVLYSTIPEFQAGIFAVRENIMSLFDVEAQRASYIFTSRNIYGNQIYVLTRTVPPSSKSGLPPFFVPVILIFVFIILLTVFTVSMSIVITRTITRSVQVLESATRRIAEGELDLNVDVKGSNEITSLTNSLNKMRNALKEEELRRSRFIMGITHDLKTPLALIKGYAEAIEDGVAEDPVSRSSAVEIIVEKADQLENMINDLIDYVRMETGEWRTQLEHINLAAFVKKLVKTFYSDVELLQHVLVHDIELPDDISVPMDERLALRAFENLIHNAVRYTPHGSSIRLAAVRRENTAELTISDNGPGIDKEALPHIFEMFYRGSSSRREQGMGLGLAVVKWVVDYHGWSINLSSEKGKGTCFVIIIPLPQK